MRIVRVRRAASVLLYCTLSLYETTCNFWACVPDSQTPRFVSALAGYHRHGQTQTPSSRPHTSTFIFYTLATTTTSATSLLSTLCQRRHILWRPCYPHC
jgi:hypothetical protein